MNNMSDEEYIEFQSDQLHKQYLVITDLQSQLTRAQELLGVANKENEYLKSVIENKAKDPDNEFKAMQLALDSSGATKDLAIRKMYDVEEKCHTVANALRNLLDIGKRDLSNPKYDGYFEAAREALAKISETK